MVCHGIVSFPDPCECGHETGHVTIIVSAWHHITFHVLMSSFYCIHAKCKRFQELQMLGYFIEVDYACARYTYIHTYVGITPTGNVGVILPGKPYRKYRGCSNTAMVCHGTIIVSAFMHYNTHEYSCNASLRYTYMQNVNVSIINVGLYFIASLRYTYIHANNVRYTYIEITPTGNVGVIHL